MKNHSSFPFDSLLILCVFVGLGLAWASTSTVVLAESMVFLLPGLGWLCRRYGSYESFSKVAGLAVVLLALICLPIINTWSALGLSVSHVVRDFSRFRGNLATPHTGADALPPPVREMRDILQENPEIVEYQLSGLLAKDTLIYQRSVEGLWPRKLVPTADHEFIRISELKQRAACVEVARGTEVVLVKRP